MTKVIIDTSLLVAQLDDKDIRHSKSLLVADSLVRTGVELIYFDCVINETITVVCRRLRQRKKEAMIGEVLKVFKTTIGKDSISWIYPAIRKYYDDCLELIKSSGGKVNFHDALIALAAKDIGASKIASFDKDFDMIDWLERIDGN